MPLGPPFVRPLGGSGPRQLSAEEVEVEVRDIETRTWPHNSVLPMKNLYDRRVGCIFRTYDGGADTIVPEIILPDKGVKDCSLTYPSLKVMVEAGWVVD